MNTDTVSKFKWFWAWQDEKEEAWLAEMAGQGLHLESITLPGTYHFRQGKPGSFVYRLDFQALKAKDRESYLQLFEDAGWEHVGDMGGWVYFRHPLNGSEVPEIYSDLDSKAGKYYRLMTYLTIFLPIMVILFPRVSDLTRYGPIAAALGFFGFLMFMLFVLGYIQLFRRITQLRKKG